MVGIVEQSPSSTSGGNGHAAYEGKQCKTKSHARVSVTSLEQRTSSKFEGQAAALVCKKMAGIEAGGSQVLVGRW